MKPITIFKRISKELKLEVTEHISGEPFVLVSKSDETKTIDAYVKAGIPRKQLFIDDICEFVQVCLLYPKP